MTLRVRKYTAQEGVPDAYARCSYEVACMQIYSLAKRMLQNCSRLQCALRDKLTVYTHARLAEYCTMHMHHEETRDDAHNGTIACSEANTNAFA